MEDNQDNLACTPLEIHEIAKNTYGQNFPLDTSCS
jgi:hypothetical protein